MKLYDLLSSTDTKPMDKIKRNVPQWINSLLLIPLNNSTPFYLVDMMINKSVPYCPSINDILATDWIKF